MEQPQSLVTEIPLMDGAVLYSSSLGNLLVGSPPEILKVLLTKMAPMPDTIVIPGTLNKFSSSQACMEFPFYHFLFIQQGLSRGQKFRVMAKESICQKLAEMLRVTLLGPEAAEALSIESRLNIPMKLDREKIEQICRETHFLALKNKKGQNYTLEELIEFVPLEIGQNKTVYPEFQGHPAVKIERTGEDSFMIRAKREFSCDLKIPEPQLPNYEIQATPVDPHEKESKERFSIRCLGASEGFDASKPSNGYLIRFMGQWILWDCPAYLRNHLKKIGITFEDISAIFVSHVHEDHLDIMQTVNENKKTVIYTSPEIFHSMLLKLSATIDCSYETAAEYYEYRPIYADRPFDLFGATMEVFYSTHSIPALGMRLSVPGKTKESKLFISGDTLSRQMINKLADAGVYSPERLEELETILPDEASYDLVIVDSGGGMIHGDPKDYYNNPHRVLHMHTGKKIQDLPENHAMIHAGQHIIIHEE